MHIKNCFLYDKANHHFLKFLNTKYLVKKNNPKIMFKKSTTFVQDLSHKTQTYF